MPLPAYYLEVMLPGGMACVNAMMMYRGGFLKVLFESFSKGPSSFPHVFIITGKVTALEPVYCPTFLTMGCLSLGGTRRLLMVLLESMAKGKP